MYVLISADILSNSHDDLTLMKLLINKVEIWPSIGSDAPCNKICILKINSVPVRTDFAETLASIFFYENQQKSQSYIVSRNL